MSYVGLDDSYGEFGAIVSQELAAAIKGNIDFLNKAIPIGHIAPIMVNIPGVPTPDPNIWQECDGSEITNPNSPLRSVGGSIRNTPNMVDKYLKVANTSGEAGSNGGVHTYNFGHNHGGSTGLYTTPEDADLSSLLFNVAAEHAHTIPSDLTATVSMEPPYYTVKFFLKIQ